MALYLLFDDKTISSAFLDLFKHLVVVGIKLAITLTTKLKHHEKLNQHHSDIKSIRLRIKSAVASRFGKL